MYQQGVLLVGTSNNYIYILGLITLLPGSDMSGDLESGSGTLRVKKYINREGWGSGI